jgi:hypothetical protein
VLVHEIIKGVMEMFAVQGLPDDGSAQDVIASEDTLEKEVWDIRLGPSIWARIRESFPEEILLDENQKELQNFLLLSIFKLEARNFLVFVKEVLEGTERGQTMMGQLMDGVRAAFTDEEDPTPDAVELQAEVQEAGEETTDEELDDFLQGLGIAGAEEPAGEEPAGGEELTNERLSGMGLNELNFQLNQAIDNEDWELAQRIQSMIERKTRR